MGANLGKIGLNDAKSTLKKKKLSILAIAEILQLPQETSRKKIQNLIKKNSKKIKDSGIIYGENFVNFHKSYSAKFAHQVANYILTLSDIDKEFFKNLLKLKI